MNWTNAKLHPKLCELHSPQGLRQNVSDLIICSHVIHFKDVLLNAILNKMIPSINVLAMIMKHRILGQLNCKLIVDEKPEFLNFTTNHLSNQLT
jgi:hypothetical protein